MQALRPGVQLRAALAVFASALLGVLLLGGSTPVAAATFTVNSTADSPDFSLSDGVCDTNDSAGNGPCTLRAALQQADEDLGLDIIHFAIPGSPPYTITPATPLPSVFMDSIVIDGTTQSGYAGTPIIELDGSAAGPIANGLLIEASSGNTIAGLAINGFGDNGIELDHVHDTTITGNYLGLDVSGTYAVPNGASGLRIRGDRNTIGGVTPSERNVISGNTAHGLMFFRSPTLATPGNTVVGNYIGTDYTGMVDLGNGIDGIYIVEGANHTIGGATLAERNVISGNNRNGITIEGLGADQNTIIGNYIGPNSQDTGHIGNGEDGISTDNADNNTLGRANAGNIITGNGDYGVHIRDGLGNSITENTISDNADAGIYLSDVDSIRNTFSGNSIYNNGGLGIDINPIGPNANDLDDSDMGGNTRQNYPMITAAYQGGSTVVETSLNSTPSTVFTIEYFASDSCDPSGLGEGQDFLGEHVTSTNAAGHSAFAVHFATVPAGKWVTATATDPQGNTSEFSACVQVTEAPGPPFPNVAVGGGVEITVRR